MKPWIAWIAAGLAVVAVGGCVDRKAQVQRKQTEELVKETTPVVNVQPVRLETVAEEVEITGEIATGQDTTVGAKQPGRIVAVYVKEGDTVSAGQLLATLDAAQLFAQLRQAQAQVSAAQAQMKQALSALAQARRNASAGPTKSSAAVRSAEAQLRSAEALLKKATTGARPEERAQAEATLSAAREILETQERELQRIQTLVKEGALAANRLDQQRSAVASARAQVQNAEQALKMLREGARSEDVAAAQEAVNQAREAVATAKAQKALDPLLKDQVTGAEAQVAAARSQVEAAQAAVAIIRQQIDDTRITAPFAGKVLGKPAQPGTIAGAQTPIVRLIGGGGVYFSGQVPATLVDRVQPGMPVQIRIDGLEGQVYSGRVDAVSPLGSSVGRLFDVRVQLTASPSTVRPGMFARGTVQLRTIQNATLVPADAVVTRGTQKLVYTVDADTAQENPITVGITKGLWVQVTGVPAGARIVTSGQEALRDGQKVRVQTARAAATDEDSQESQS